MKFAPDVGMAIKLPMIMLMLFFLSFSLLAHDVPDSDIFMDDECPFGDYLFFEEHVGITITGALHTTQQMAVVTREDIELRVAPDIAALLQEALGLNLVRYGPHGNQTGISLRGFDSRRVAFLVNGIPANSPLDGRFDIFQIDPNSIERIEIIYGGSDSRFNVSAALGGVINIVTIARQAPEFRFGFSVSNTSAMPGRYRGRDGQVHGPRFEDLLDTQNYAISFGYGGGMFSATANVFYNRAGNRFLAEDNLGITRRSDNNEVWDTGAAVSLLWELPNFTRLISSSRFYYGDRNFPSAQFSREFGNQQDTTYRQSFMLEMPRIFHDNLATEVSFTFDMARRTFADSGNAVSQHNQHAISVINRWSWYANGIFTLRSGFDFTFTQLESTEMGTRGRHDGGLHLATEIRLGRRFFIVPSISAVATSGGTTEVVPVPKFGLLWNITDTVSIRNNYFRSFKFPGFQELYWTGAGGYGNPDLLPQDGWGTDLGVTWSPNRRVRLESVFFAQWTRNSIHWFHAGGGIWMPENVGGSVFCWP